MAPGKNGRPKQLKFLFILLLTPSLIFSQVKSPSEPEIPFFSEPDIPIEEKKEIPHGTPVHVLAIHWDGTTNTGTVYFPRPKILFYFDVNGQNYHQTFSVSNISRITFLEWEAQTEDNNSYVFYPVKVRVITGEGYTLTCTYNIKELNKLPFRGFPGNTVLYSYYYDYWIKDHWKNNGSGKHEEASLNPPTACLRELIFP